MRVLACSRPEGQREGVEKGGRKGVAHLFMGLQDQLLNIKAEKRGEKRGKEGPGMHL